LPRRGFGSNIAPAFAWGRLCAARVRQFRTTPGHRLMKPKFFASPAQFRTWLAAHHATETELLVGFFKKGSGKPSLTWPESVAEALCFGWIDGVRKNVSEDAYSIRFTPRKPTSNWSAINVALIARLEEQGKLTAAGRHAFAARTRERTGVYSHERNAAARFTAEQERELRAHGAAAAFFDAQPAWYRRAASHWVISAKREETRARRLKQLIEDSAAGRTIAPLTRPAATTGKTTAGNATKSPATQERKRKLKKRAVRA
jgi:uncharacterized protein YdeI (YjbR/CyaY-like superfamily)